MGNVRVSFGRNSAGALEIMDANDYYPFGMNHSKTGNAFFAQGSYKAYKFVGNELQETGFYDMNARFFMPDLGIFGQHDPLSASTLDPYGYAYNNPIMFADPTGLEGDPVNGGGGVPQSIGTSTNPIDVGEIVLNAPIRAMANNSNLPTCTYCMTGVREGVKEVLNLPPPPIRDMRPVLNNGSAQMMDGLLWDVAAIYITNNVKPENKYAAMAVAVLAIIISRGHTADEVLKAETSIAKAELAAERAEMTTVGRWMSKGEYDAMKKGTTVLEGAGGQTFVTQGGSHVFPSAAKGSVYAEFQVPTNSLLQGGKDGWLKILGPNAGKSQQFILQKQGGSLLPQYQNLSPILKTK